MGKVLLPSIEAWAAAHPHTGSRKNYWPEIFNDIKEYAPGLPYIKRLNHCKLRKQAARFYSLKLEFAWKDVLHDPAEVGDWYRD